MIPSGSPSSRKYWGSDPKTSSEEKKGSHEKGVGGVEGSHEKKSSDPLADLDLDLIEDTYAVCAETLLQKYLETYVLPHSTNNTNSTNSRAEGPRRLRGGVSAQREEPGRDPDSRGVNPYGVAVPMGTKPKRFFPKEEHAVFRVVLKRLLREEEESYPDPSWRSSNRSDRSRGGHPDPTGMGSEASPHGVSELRICLGKLGPSRPRIRESVRTDPHESSATNPRRRIGSEIDRRPYREARSGILSSGSGRLRILPTLSRQPESTTRRIPLSTEERRSRPRPCRPS